MRIVYRTFVAAALGLWGAGALAAGSVQVSFVDADHFTDAGPWGKARDDSLQRLAKHLEGLGAKALADGQSLKVEVLDVDLAGRLNPFGSHGDLRIVNGRADWPRIKLRYSLEAGGRVLQKGEESLADMNYLQHATPRNDSDPLRYENAMLDNWFKSRFGAAAAP